MSVSKHLLLRSPWRLVTFTALAATALLGQVGPAAAAPGGLPDLVLNARWRSGHV